MTRVDLDELERKALAAANGPRWIADTSGRYTDGWWSTGRCVQKHAAAQTDAEHIAANSPDVTLALIARIRELETALDGMTTNRDIQMSRADAMTEERGHLAAEVSSLTAELDQIEISRDRWRAARQTAIKAGEELKRRLDATRAELEAMRPVVEAAKTRRDGTGLHTGRNLDDAVTAYRESKENK